MKISALEEYGLRCLVQLARAGAEPTGSVTLSTRQIAEMEGLTLEYTAQILATLRRAGLVSSVRGVHGGFRLAHPAAELNVGRLFRTLDGAIDEGICSSYTGNADTCTHAAACNVAPVWAELARRIYGFLDRVSLADIAAGDVATGPQIVPLTALRKR
jgi:Rrf2 family transcriptional regulator, iron-sulfur cluster assembly transcription factor